MLKNYGEKYNKLYKVFKLPGTWLKVDNCLYLGHNYKDITDIISHKNMNVYINIR